MALLIIKMAMAALSIILLLLPGYNNRSIDVIAFWTLWFSITWISPIASLIIILCLIYTMAMILPYTRRTSDVKGFTPVFLVSRACTWIQWAWWFIMRPIEDPTNMLVFVWVPSSIFALCINALYSL